MTESKSNRTQMPNRRPSMTIPIEWSGSDGSPRMYHVTVGFYMDGSVKEVFANGEKEGSQIDAMLSDACILVSLALQNGVSSDNLAHSMVRVPGVAQDPFGTATNPASPIGAIVDAVRKLQSELFEEGEG